MGKKIKALEKGEGKVKEKGGKQGKRGKKRGKENGRKLFFSGIWSGELDALLFVQLFTT